MEEVTVRFTETDAFHTFIYAGDLKLLYALIVLMVVDIATGVGKAIKNKNLWSRKSLFGFSRKIFIFSIVILANIIDQVLGMNGGLVILTMFFYIANEGLSIVENCSEMGIVVPKEIAEKLNVIKETKQETKNTLKNEFTNDADKDDKSLRK
ncbi:phage holin family protein [Staphylococcus xylosus]|uniref:phage holin family protein n=1 Tax=Staphylococcus xylosus TaxID=1288 RepID=UPI001CDBE938|nr:phage holin family protein [Staphylococcus xylosus]MCQ3816720.1 holin [Staphylococcus xylosus]MCQ3819226.1 holin [Staphylococcus xylosus]UBV36653.1 phage holin family protein [Staphylococcus xylosus]